MSSHAGEGDPSPPHKNDHHHEYKILVMILKALIGLLTFALFLKYTLLPHA
jgi:hypothetical protein